MDIGDDGAAHALEERSIAAAEMLERSLMRALGNVEAELARVVRTGEADLERLAGLIVEIIAKASSVGLSNNSWSTSEAGAPSSANEIAAAIARMVRRGARFS